MLYVITCGDEGVQVNEGTRLAVVGAGLDLAGFSDIVSVLKKQFGNELRIAASEENAWVKGKLNLNTWEQTNASGQQQIEALADREGLLYAGSLPFADPQELKHGVKGHMVRPHNIHIATKVTFTLDGGEQTYHLGQFLISAEWVSELPFKQAKELIDIQVTHYQSLVGDMQLSFTVQQGGELGEKVAAQNKALLEKMGYSFAE
jgi:hypothetical protein